MTIEKISVNDILPLINGYYRDNPAGGSLHIVLDDGNVDNSSVLYCLACARENNDTEGEKLASMLLTMSKTQRKKLYRTPKC